MDAPRLRSHAAVAAVLAVMVAGGVGIYAFVLSLRPCLLRLEPGSVVTYRLRTEYSELAPGGAQPARVHEQVINLICIGRDNEVAMLSPASGPGQHEAIDLLAFASDGSVRRIEGDQRSDEGKALGFFDFNLLPLPPGSEQAWNVSLVYAALPPGRRQVQGRVKRISNSARPEFQLKLNTIEWIDAASGRYRQVKDPVCTYRFDTRRGVIESATVRLQAGIERADGDHHFTVCTTLELAGVDRLGDDAVAVRDLALASAELQGALAADRRERLAPLMRRLADATVADPRLLAVATRLLADAGRRLPRPAAPAAPALNWVVQIGPLPATQRAQLVRLGETLIATGVPCSLADLAGGPVLRAGPYARQDQALLARVQRQAGRLRAQWVRGP